MSESNKGTAGSTMPGGEVCAKCGRQTDEPYIDTDTAIERFRNGKSIFTPPRELQAAISSALRATGKLDGLRGGRPRPRRRS